MLCVAMSKLEAMYVKKEDIINTALKLFNSHSYNSIGVDRIISESGSSQNDIL